MESHEVMRETIGDAGTKPVATDMALSPSLVYKWCQAKGDDQSGADNPLDRILKLCQVTGNPLPVIWLCEQMDAFYVENMADGPLDNAELGVLDMSQRMLKEFSEMLDMVARSMRNDNGVDKDEARAIRVEWEDLKRVAEQFVLGCEMGYYAPTEKKKPNN